MFREYNPEKDKEAVHRIWKEIGWLEENEEALDTLIDASRAWVAEINGEAECLVLTTPGTIRYLREDLPFSCVNGVGTSRIARKQGFAGKLTALTIAQSASEGALVTGLGMFEQGFYNRLGFGTGSYEHWVSFDPASLTAKKSPKVPTRLTKDDWERIHASRIHRKKSHGSCTLHSPKITKSEMEWSKKFFGLGYFDSNNTLTHHLWFGVRSVEHGPYTVKWISYQNYEQLLELMGLIKNLGDQVRLVSMCEPTGIQLQDLLNKPFKRGQITKKSKYEQYMRAMAYWQMRILDLEGCMEKTHLSDEVSFNLKLTDPIETMLDDTQWHGIGGKYVVTLGPESHAKRGSKEKLPTLNASIGAFTRMWLGVRSATSLAVTDDLAGPENLLAAIDRVLRIPRPHPDWDF
ncbi:MAG: GNAT family N-acetyltransferase [Euryarchaeota archaeon]|nr:GNAT family N-acetyltransferase [Euryarchaeota archaeon]